MALEHRIREAIDAFHSRMRHDLDSHVRSLTSDVLRVAQENQDEWRQQFERGVTEGRNSAERDFRNRLEMERAEAVREAERDFRNRLDVERADAIREAEQRIKDMMPLAAANSSSSAAARSSRGETLRRLVASIRRIDDAVTLSGILEALAHAAAAEAPRVAIFLIEQDTLRLWGHFGFAAGQGPVDVAIAQAGGLATAISTRQTFFVPPTGARDASMPPFMRIASGRSSAAVPLAVGGDVVALLYADDVGQRDDQEDAPLWSEEIDLLVRHAALRLENVTSLRTVEVLSQ